MEEDIFRNCGVEVELPAKTNCPTEKERYRDAFLRIRETLTRIGIASYKTNSLYQSVHLLHKRGRYALMHFKELFFLDGKPTNISDEDLGRRNQIATMLQEYGLLTIKDPSKVERCIARNHIKIIPFTDKSKWKLVPKYTIGQTKTGGISASGSTF